MLIVIDHSDATPIYRQIVRQVSDQIGSGQIPAGEKLPTAGELADSLDLNRNTVLQAYRELRDNGAIELRRGRGAIVLDSGASTDLVTDAVAKLASLADQQGVPLSRITAMLNEKGLS